MVEAWDVEQGREVGDFCFTATVRINRSPDQRDSNKRESSVFGCYTFDFHLHLVKGKNKFAFVCFSNASKSKPSLPLKLFGLQGWV